MYSLNLKKKCRAAKFVQRELWLNICHSSFFTNFKYNYFFHKYIYLPYFQCILLPSKTGRDSLLSDTSEKELNSRLSLELFLWCFLFRRQKLRRAEPDPRRFETLNSSESGRLRLSDGLLCNDKSSSSLKQQKAECFLNSIVKLCSCYRH